MTTNPLEALGWSKDEIDAAKASAEAHAPRRDGRVCICGHPAKTHSGEGESDVQKALHAAGRDQCRYGRMKCPCAEFEPVLDSSNVRSFTFKTTGVGPDHALSRGIMSAVEKGAEVEWTITPVCKWPDCQSAPGSRVTVVAVSQYGKRSTSPEPLNGFFCDEHLAGL